MDRGYNIILVTIIDTEKQCIELNTTESRAINGILEVRVGVKLAKLVTLAPIHDMV